jgi:hypothetical protein
VIHANIIDGIAEEDRGEITRALMGLEPAPPVPPKLQGARLPPIGVPVRTLKGAPLGDAMRSLTGAIPGGAPVR